MKREVVKLTKNTFYIDMVEYYGEEKIKEISEREQLTGDDLKEYLYKKLEIEFNLFLASRLSEFANFNEQGECTQIVNVEYDDCTWVWEVKHSTYMQHQYIDVAGNAHNFLPVGYENDSRYIMGEQDVKRISTKMKPMKPAKRMKGVGLKRMTA